jgi:hypothetical protein
MLLSTKSKELFMTNSNYGKIYNSFAEHPLAPIYFKYIDILISRDLNYDIQYLLDIAHSPITAENTEIFTNIIAELIKIANEDDFNEFEELRLQLENPN